MYHAKAVSAPMNEWGRKKRLFMLRCLDEQKKFEQDKVEGKF